MKLNKQIVGSGDLTFDYFLKGGFIGCTCPNCSSSIDFRIKIYQSGILVEKLEQELIIDLLEKQVINMKDENMQLDSHLSKYTLWRMDAQFEKICCETCSENMIAIFGMAEIQPGREYVQFKGIWSLKST